MTSCQKKLPTYQVYNNFILGQVLKKNERFHVPDSARCIIKTLSKGKKVLIYEDNYLGKNYESIIDTKQNKGVLSAVNVYFTSSGIVGDENTFIKDNNNVVRSFIIFENPELGAINDEFEKYILEMLQNKYGEEYKTNEYNSSNYNEQSFNPDLDVQIKERVWNLDYLNVKFLKMTAHGTYTSLRIYYNLKEEYWKKFSEELSIIKNENSNF